MDSVSRQVSAVRLEFKMAVGAGAQSFTMGIVLTSPAVEEVRLTVRLTVTGGLATHSLMNDLSQDAWFYAQNGEKGGPIDFSTLQGMAKEGKLHPRQDLIWAKGMDRWKPAGEIQGLFERQHPVGAPVAAETAVVVSGNPAVDPYESSGRDGYGQSAAKVVMPGARRRSYLFFLLVFPVLWFALVWVAGTFLSEKVDQETLAMIASGLFVLPGLVALGFSIMRLVNLGMSGWWFLGNFVPFLNLWVGYRCFACPAGYAIHKKMDGVGVFLAIIYWLLMLAGIAAFGAVVAVIFFDLGSPELREQIVGAIREGANLPAER